MAKKENQGFICIYCHAVIAPLTNGSYRNHCPYCLWSRHVDNSPGDRSSQCYSSMKPVNYRYHSKKGYQILHLCQACGKEQWNKVATATLQEDDFLSFIRKVNL